jgi:hypothetical protein
MSERFRLASGIILASISLMLIVAYFSFFFHGAEDIPSLNTQATAANCVVI